jgi:uncharacterized protein
LGAGLVGNVRKRDMNAERPILPSEVAERLGPYYVYVLVDPRDAGVFYVGKGTGVRLLSHGIAADLTHDPGQSTKLARIREIRSLGQEPIVEVVRHNLDEKAAFLVEAALIDCLSSLTNKVVGHDVQRGRAPLSELVTRYGAAPLAVFDPPVLMIRLTPRWKPRAEEMEPGYRRTGAGFYPGMTPIELYDAVRGWWKLNPRSFQRQGVRHVVAVTEGITRAIYEVDEWIGPHNDRWAFKGRLIDSGRLWEEYIGPWGHRVPFSTHSQNPLVYWPLRS